ncbi:hypothetical protein C2S53_006477 [Perilla frutescens var. hirtella]|uniref:Pectinesterase inhibitor domain-containing protein n=1 Tax=Perilla frutescens var. hirtella TaxID=608512 RepID=A0AAD4NZK8_PERFH|nr:hypothetical protein C2S53_006477 [Perilla frutescens var. hirtella]
MSSSIITSTLVIFLVSSILISFSTPIAATPSSTLIKKACSSTRGGLDLKSCTQLLESQSLVVSVTNLFDLSVGIIKSGISRSTNTLKYVESLLEKSGMDPNLKVALQECKSSYDSVIGSLHSALTEITDKDYETSTYDLLIAGTDNIEVCQNAMTSKGIKDEIILSGNKAIPIFAFSGYQIVESIRESKNTFNVFY